ncbi:hypothetical protein DXG01_009470 [Tephrocybe rancida]|nr:hypothetical protein DXG01_009470 [Tephrocybe rancida]
MASHITQSPIEVGMDAYFHAREEAERERYRLLPIAYHPTDTMSEFSHAVLVVLLDHDGRRINVKRTSDESKDVKTARNLLKRCGATSFVELVDVPPSIGTRQDGRPRSSRDPVMDAPPPYNAANNGINHSKHPASDNPKPPDYSQPLEPGLSPRYDFPQTFAIGARCTNAPLVSSAQLKNHLALLHAFAGLRTRIDGLYPGRNEEIPFLPREGERRWGWFVGLAVERFSVWCGGLNEGGSNKRARDILPPVDVLMVWHAYMLNPGYVYIIGTIIQSAHRHASWYAEDCSRINALRGLKSLTPVFSNSFVRLHHTYLPLPPPQRLRQASELEDILMSEPTQSRLDFWDVITHGRHFDPIRDAELHHTRNVLCPKCRRSLLITYMKEDSTGFFQEKFQIQCPSHGCQDLPRITRTLLGARKLAEDLAGTTVKADVLPTPSLAGTLRTTQNATDTARGTLVRNTILRGLSFERPTGSTEGWAAAILTSNKYDLEVLRKAMAEKMSAGRGNLYVRFHSNVGADDDPLLGRLRRIISAYQTAYVFSIDLVGAVLRQGSFVKKMHDLQWTRPGFFDSKDDEVVLQHSIARYHALFLDSFLDLMSASNTSFFVPTLDIDLAWHTHQLLWQSYHNDCMNYVGRYVDQLVLSYLPLTGDPASHSDDKVEEQTLATAFDVTCRAWKNRFNMSYTHCGCPLPGTTIGQRLSRLVNHYGAQKSYLIPPAREDLLAATHPSDHNAVFVWHRKQFSEGLQQRRRGKFKERQERDARERGEGKARAFTPEERRQVDAHEAAFLVPVPLYYGYGVCAAYTGAVVYSVNDNGIGGCAAGGGACAAGVGGCSGGACGGGGGGDAGMWGLTISSI